MDFSTLKASTILIALPRSQFQGKKTKIKTAIYISVYIEAKAEKFLIHTKIHQ